MRPPRRLAVGVALLLIGCVTTDGTPRVTRTVIGEPGCSLVGPLGSVAEVVGPTGTLDLKVTAARLEDCTSGERAVRETPSTQRISTLGAVGAIAGLIVVGVVATGLVLSQRPVNPPPAGTPDRTGAALAAIITIPAIGAVALGAIALAGVSVEGPTRTEDLGAQHEQRTTPTGGTLKLGDQSWQLDEEGVVLPRALAASLLASPVTLDDQPLQWSAQAREALTAATK